MNFLYTEMLSSVLFEHSGGACVEAELVRLRS